MKPLSLATLFFTATALAAATAGAQQAARPIRVLNQFQAGGGADAIVRPLLDPVATDLGRPVLMDYKPGAAGAIAAAELEKGAPDGSTLIIDTQTLALNTVLRKGKNKRFRGMPGKQQDSKRAIVRLAEGDKIDVTTRI